MDNTDKKVLVNIIIIIIIIFNLYFLLTNFWKKLTDYYVLEIDSSINKEIFQILENKPLQKNINETNLVKIELARGFPNGYDIALFYKDLDTETIQIHFTAESDGYNGDTSISDYMLKYANYNYSGKIQYFSVIAITILLIIALIYINVKCFKNEVLE